jgi:hypothetical protein
MFQGNILPEKTVIREVIESKFDSALPIEAYLENFEGIRR